jgi:hypothetical protein
MNQMLQVFIGWDSREPVAFAVCAHSLLTRARIPISITPLVQPALRQTHFYTRERGSTESTEFSLTRFLVPALCGYRGIAVFMDCDFLVQADITELLAYALSSPESAVLVCQHEYVPKPDRKFLGQPQTVYPKKNWSSLMVFHAEQCRALTPDYVNTASGLDLHRFTWLRDDQVGALPLHWNHLVGEGPHDDHAKAYHYTLGGPWHGGMYADGPAADRWRHEWRQMTGDVLQDDHRIAAVRD